MSQSVHVVDGEASESDSDAEVAKSPDAKLSNKKGLVVSGEAPESDDESKVKCLEPNDLDVPLNIAMTPPPTPSKIYNSLLHQKLWECNVSLRATIEGLVRHTTDISVEKLTKADKTLLNVQKPVVPGKYHTLAADRHPIVLSSEVPGALASILGIIVTYHQESMRATNANLMLARARLNQLHAELEKANCSAALPTVKINP